MQVEKKSWNIKSNAFYGCLDWMRENYTNLKWEEWQNNAFIIEKEYYGHVWRLAWL
jgi:hypothetical protein